MPRGERNVPAATSSSRLIMDKKFFSTHERETWDAFVSGSPYGHILQSWEWGELKSRAGWTPIRQAMVENGTIRSASQILVRSLPYNLGRLAYVPKGPVLDYRDTSLLACSLAALRELAAEQRVLSLKIEPEVVEPESTERQLLAAGLKPAPAVQMRSTIWIDLRASEEEILARQKPKTRYNTRLSARKGVIVSSSCVEGVDAWYEMFRVTAKRDGFSIHGLEYYRSVLEILGQRDMAKLLLAHHDGELLAGIIVFRFGRLAQYMYGASSNSKRNLMAPYLLQWEAMRWAKEAGATTYDLWGIPERLEENDDLWGVYRHKRGYGGEIVRYIGAYDIVQSPWQHFVLERVARPLFKQVARRNGQQPQ